MTTKERLHKLVDGLSDQEADDALRYIVQRREDPVIAAFHDAPEDDEPVTAADEQALAEVQADLARRDAIDSNRAVSPLKTAPDALVIDTTARDVGDVVAEIVSRFEAAGSTR